MLTHTLRALGVLLVVAFLFLGISGAISSRVCIPGLACISGNGTYIYIDTNGDGDLDTDEPNLTINSPTGTAGDETIQGDLIVTGSVSVSGVTAPFDSLVGRTWITSTTIPDTNGNCWIYGYYLSPRQACTNGDSYMVLPFDTAMTRFCVQSMSGFTATGSCVVELINTTDTTTLSSVNVSNSGGNMTGVAGQYYCASVGTTQDAGDKIAVRPSTSTCTPGAWGVVEFTLWGHGVD